MKIKKVLATHNGLFHCDEVMATAILSSIFDVEIIRSRNPKELETADIVYDVGGGKYDHHTTEKEYRENGIPYASAGLIWKDFGKEFIRNKASLSEEKIEEALKLVDERLMQSIDAIDNGIEIITESKTEVLTLSDIISALNPTWNENTSSDESFNEAVKLATLVLNRVLNNIIAEFDAEKIVLESLANRETPEILILYNFCPWQKTLLESKEGKDVLFVIFKDVTNTWRVQVVPKELGSFEARKSLPQEWAGKRDTELASITGVSDAIFCHPGKFIAGAQSFEGILRMAKLALLQ